MGYLVDQVFGTATKPANAALIGGPLAANQFDKYMFQIYNDATLTAMYRIPATGLLKTLRVACRSLYYGHNGNWEEFGVHIYRLASGVYTRIAQAHTWWTGYAANTDVVISFGSVATGVTGGWYAPGGITNAATVAVQEGDLVIFGIVNGCSNVNYKTYGARVYCYPLNGVLYQTDATRYFIETVTGTKPFTFGELPSTTFPSTLAGGDWSENAVSPLYTPIVELTMDVLVGGGTKIFNPNVLEPFGQRAN